MYQLKVYDYSAKVVDTTLWVNFKTDIVGDITGDMGGMRYRYWRSLTDDVLRHYDAVLNDISGHVEFKSAEQRMAFVLRYS